MGRNGVCGPSGQSPPTQRKQRQPFNRPYLACFHATTSGHTPIRRAGSFALGTISMIMIMINININTSFETTIPNNGTRQRDAEPLK
jgi:hypothetical protein